MGLFGFNGKDVKDAGEGVKSAANGLGGLAESIRFAITGDMAPETIKSLLEIAGKLELEKAKLINSVNIVDAQSKNPFQFGWRPFIGWVAGFSLFFYYIPQFIGANVFWIINMISDKKLLSFPIGDGGILELVLGLVGLGALRTAEKLGNVQNKH